MRVRPKIRPGTPTKPRHPVSSPQNSRSLQYPREGMQVQKMPSFSFIIVHSSKCHFFITSRCRSSRQPTAAALHLT